MRAGFLMASPAITIKIDFGSESGSGAGNTVAVSGAVPTPASAGVSAPASQSGGVVPTPFDSAAQSMAQAELGAPAPSPSLVPGGTAGWASDSSDLGDVPTPFSAGGLLPQGAGQPIGMVPTPMDSVHGSSLTGDQAPTAGSMGQAGGTPPSGMVPTPVDSVYGSSVTGDQAPTPDFESMGSPEETRPAPSHPAETSARRTRKKA